MGDHSSHIYFNSEHITGIYVYKKDNELDNNYLHTLFILLCPSFPLPLLDHRVHKFKNNTIYRAPFLNIFTPEARENEAGSLHRVHRIHCFPQTVWHKAFHICPYHLPFVAQSWATKQHMSSCQFRSGVTYVTHSAGDDTTTIRRPVQLTLPGDKPQELFSPSSISWAFQGVCPPRPHGDIFHTLLVCTQTMIQWAYCKEVHSFPLTYFLFQCVFPLRL